MTNQMKEFPITVYGNLEKFNEVISKARCRIFYKGVNRNATFISDEFAAKLMSTISYAPVKGIYDGEDYTDHGASRSLGRIYGIVPQDPNFAWEKHLDDDGVEREYACVDVLLFTALYKEAGEAIGKAQSMELYSNSIKGDWQIIDGKKVFAFTDACFLGLQVLGKETEPCFEGSAFFSLGDSLNQILLKIEQYNLNLENNRQGGTETMPMVNYNLSDGAKFEALWSQLNTRYNEENNFVVDYDICTIGEDYAVVKNYAENVFERIYFKKKVECEVQDATPTNASETTEDETMSENAKKKPIEDPEDPNKVEGAEVSKKCGGCSEKDETAAKKCGTCEVEIDEKKKCCVLDVTEAEKSALDALCALNQGSYEKLDELYNATMGKISELEQKNVELANEFATLKTEKENVEAQYAEAKNLLNESKSALESAQESFSAMQAENATLVEYKKAIELKEKQAVIDSYSDLLEKAILDEFAAKVEDYTAIDLDKELAYALKNSKPEVFSKTPAQTFIPKDNQVLDGLTAILSKYKK